MELAYISFQLLSKEMLYCINVDVSYDTNILVLVYGRVDGPITSNVKFTFEPKIIVVNNEEAVIIGISNNYYINPKNEGGESIENN